MAYKTFTFVSGSMAGKSISLPDNIDSISFRVTKDDDTFTKHAINHVIELYEANAEKLQLVWRYDEFIKTEYKEPGAC